MADRLYTTREMMALVGVKSRTTIYAHGWKPDTQLPGDGTGLWSRKTITAIGKELGVKVVFP